ncbi:MAG TPA: ester cyclase [Ktedonobacterales bacterium]|jgi:steroid delta-isomerase-like uncharacterized protein
MTAQENEALVRAQLDLYNSHLSDSAWIEKKGEIFTEDFELVDISSGTVLRGAEGFQQSHSFYKEAFHDHQVEIVNVVATEDQVVVEFVGRGTHSGPLRLPTGHVPSTGRQGELRCCNVYQIRDGKISSIRSYYCGKTLREQVGLGVS